MNRTLPRNMRVLALDVRSNRIGYAVFEHDSLIDAGITRFKTSGAGASRLIFLTRRIQPHVLVLRILSAKSSRNSRRTRAILRAAQRIAKHFSVRVAFVSEQQIQKRFLQDGASTKYQIAVLVVRSFSCVAWRLPPPRKAWQGEHRNMAIFDAAALGMAYLASPQTNTSP
jgi:RNase H-fold protein (predicted Holliday junction resolvase)